MNHQSVVTLFVVVAAIALCIQAGILLALFLMIRNAVKQIQDLLQGVTRVITPVLEVAAAILADSREPIQRVTSNLSEISRLVANRAQGVDALLEETTEKVRRQLVRIDQMMGVLLEKIESTAGVIQRGVMAPVLELSAIAKGVQSGLEYFISRRRSAAKTQSSQDEELFI